jgi:hypothetical protein
MDAVWFERRLDLGVQPEGAFVDHVRERAPAALGALVPPSATWSTDYADCLLVVDHPALVRAGEQGTTTVQVNWSAGRLAGSWSTTALWDDDDPRDADALLVQGVDMTDHEAALAAVEWLARQLSRPVDHEIRALRSAGDAGRPVDRLRERLQGETWVLADTGRTLVMRGSILGRRGPVRSACRIHPPVPGDVVEKAWAGVVRDCRCPDQYFCPSAGEVECPRHGGFGTCCAHPDGHRPLPPDLRVRDPRPPVDPADIDDDG